MNVLFVCMGNICRSPMAEGLLRKLYAENSIPGEVDSAGFESFHINDPPDERALAVAMNHQIDISAKRARLFIEDDFDRFDRIYVMDTQNMEDVQGVARNEQDLSKVDYLLNVVSPGKNLTVPNPYFSGMDDCGKVFYIMKTACLKIAEEAQSFRK
jgi:protein-tyrosine phosphatase